MLLLSLKGGSVTAKWMNSSCVDEQWLCVVLQTLADCFSTKRENYNLFVPETAETHPEPQ
jgi:hypothetical protein